MKSYRQSICSLAASLVLLSSVFCAAQAAPLGGNAAQNIPQTRRAQATYGKLPLTFEANRGQADPQVKFVAHGSGYSVFLTSGQMVLALRSSVSSNGDKSPAANAAGTAGTVLRLNLVGANPSPAVAGENLQPGKVNYFIGKDPKKWQTNVPIYKQVHYTAVYPGIDLVYYGNQGRVEHDFVVAPGADPRQIQMEIQGADRLSLAANGDLILHKGNDEVRLEAPIVYQEFRGMQVPVTGHYKLLSPTRVSFALGPYDKTMPLVIDPVLVYGTFLGGLANDAGAGIAVDSAGSAYVVGSTASTNFPVASEAGPPPSGENAFVAKLDVSGSSLVYADYIGGSSDDYAQAMVLDGSNQVFLTGYTYSYDFPTVNPYQATNAGWQSAFVTEVSADGSALVYSTYLGGSSSTQGNAIAVDGSGDIYVGGYTYAQDFPTANAAESTVPLNQNSGYGNYGFLTVFAPDGSSLVYSTYYGGGTTVLTNCYQGQCYPSPTSTVSGVAVDSAGNAYVAGVTNTYDFPVTTGAYQTTNSTSNDQQVGFIGKFSPTGSLLYSTYFDASALNSYYANLNAIAVDATGVYVTGFDYAHAAPVTSPNVCDPSQTYCSSGFLTKLDPTLTNLIYSTYLVADTDAEAEYLVLDSSGDAYVACESGSGDVSQLVNPIESYTNQWDVLVEEVDPTGSIQLFGTFLGGYGNDFPGGIALDSSGAIYITGNTDSTDYPVTAAALQNTLGGNTDAFVTKIGTAAAPAVALSPSLIQFSIRPVGSVSQPNTSLLRNMGSAPLTISNLTLSGDFSETDTCSSGVAAASTCTFTVTFTPTQPGPRFGSIMIEDNAAGSPHFINLVGNGSTAVADLNPTSLAFPSLQINQTSSAQTATLTNNGNATLVISNIATTGDYAETDNCPASLGIGSSCTFSITFTPTSGGARNGTLSITDNAPGSPQSVSLTGSGYVTTATVVPSSLNFSTQAVGTTSSSQPVVVTDTGANPITISAVTASGDFTETDDCVTAKFKAAAKPAVSGSCTINVTFTPTAAGSRSGTLTINDNAQGNPHTVALSGTGLAATAQLSASSLAFTAQAVGSTSSQQTITVTNSGNGALIVTSVQATGDFAQTNNCTTVAANGGTCAVQVTFTPTASGARTGTLTIADSAANSPQLVSLSGTGLAGVASLSASSLTFTGLAVGATSSAQTLTVTNSGNGALTFTAVQAIGDFAQNNNCATVAVSGTCSIQVTFTPTASGSRTGSLVLTDSAANSPQVVLLSGTGLAGGASLSTSSLTFSGLAVGTTSSAQTVTVTNSGNTTLTVTSVQTSGDFGQTNNCTTVAASGTCSIQVTFTPTASGTRSGTLALTDSAANSPQLVSLTGSGIDFSMPASGGTATIAAGATATYHLSINPVGGSFSSAINLACAGLPAFSTCTLNPTSVTPGASAASVTVSVKTTGTTAQLSTPIAPGGIVLAWLALMPAFGLCGLCLAGTRRERKRVSLLLLLIVLLGLTMLLPACGTSTGGTPPVQKGNSTPSGTYTVLVIGTSGSVQHFSSLTLTVQ